MVTPDLISYVKQRIAAGNSTDEIARTLLAEKWSVEDINAALNAAKGASPAVPVPVPQPTSAAPTGAPALPHAHRSITLPFTLSRTVLGYTAGVLAVLLIIGGVAYAYTQNLGPFSHAPYSEKNLMSGLLAASAKIDSSAYAVSGTFTTEPREKDAVPFTLQTSNEAQLRQQLQDDAERLRTATTFMGMYRSGPYPAAFELPATANSYYRGNFSTTDPTTGAPYAYRATEGGRNFALQVTFASDAAIAAIKRYRYSATSTPIAGKTVTFTKDSYPYLYLSSEPQKPWFVRMQELTRLLPADLSATLAIGAAANWDTKDTDWKFNADAEGDFGDLTYKFNADVLKKEKNYYVRINNLPSLFLGSFANLKGQWVVITPEDASSTTSYSSAAYLARSLPRSETEYKKVREEWSGLIVKAAQFADEERLFAFKSAPRAEKVDGRLLYRYELEIRKEAIVPFYKRLAAEANAHPSTASSRLFNDQGMLNYLESKEFEEVFAYYQKNTALTLYVDPQGYPAIIEESVRLVPPDTAEQLKEKQLRAVLRLTLSDINKRVSIDVPKDVKSIKDIADPYSQARAQGTTAAQKANLSSVRAQAELFYDANNGYSKVTVAPGPCHKVAGSLFGDSSVYSYITSAAPGNDASKATCTASKAAYAVSVPLASDLSYSWCVDSTGASKQIVGALKGSACK